MRHFFAIADLQCNRGRMRDGSRHSDLYVRTLFRRTN